MYRRVEVSRIEQTVAHLRSLLDRLERQLMLLKGGATELDSYVMEDKSAPERSNLCACSSSSHRSDPMLAEQILHMRRLRRRFFEADLFADPAWDIFLTLFAAREHQRQVSVTSLTIASDVPGTTALRWITMMTDRGILKRTPDPSDKRRAYIALSEDVAKSMEQYFDEVGSFANQFL